jgi:shikimate dehydrogenase
MPEPVKQLGLIGKPLSHSFSETYFSEKFHRQGISGYRYQLFELQSIDEFVPLLKEWPSLIGLNVTIPYKKEVIPFMHELSNEAKSIGAVNVIKIESGKLSGYNSDYYGFQASLFNWLPVDWQGKALILGTGGASLAVIAVLQDRNIPFKLVSRFPGPGLITYQQVQSEELIMTHKLLINTTPLGMYPNTEAAPDLDYAGIEADHFLFDLVYNPETTRFMVKGLERGAQVKNGLEMLELQAEKSWEIWTQPSVENDKSQSPNHN